MKPNIASKCEICGGPKGRYFNHEKCSKIKQQQHTLDKRPHKQTLDTKRQKYLSKTGERYDT